MASNRLIHDIALLSLATCNENSKRNYLKRIAKEEHVTDEELSELIKKLNNKDMPEELKSEWFISQGRLFEGHIAKRLKEEYNFVSWTSDKSADGVVAPSASDPDLTFSLFSANDKQFAVECKWHNPEEENRRKNLARFAKNSNQVEKYKKYQDDTGIPCFIAVGYGNTGTEIEELYIMPLDYILKYKKNATNISIERIKEFRVTDLRNKIEVIEKELRS